MNTLNNNGAVELKQGFLPFVYKSPLYSFRVMEVEGVSYGELAGSQGKNANNNGKKNEVCFSNSLVNVLYLYGIDGFTIREQVRYNKHSRKHDFALYSCSGDIAYFECKHKINGGSDLDKIHGHINEFINLKEDATRSYNIILDGNKDIIFSDKNIKDACGTLQSRITEAEQLGKHINIFTYEEFIDFVKCSRCNNVQELITKLIEYDSMLFFDRVEKYNKNRGKK